MGGRVGGLTHKFHRETRGIKVAGGQRVKAGTILTREGHRWRPGLNVVGQNHLTAVVEGNVYFTKKKNNYNKVVTVINVKPAEVKAKSRARAKAKKAE
jgi:ribosomal protein L27